MTFGKNQAEVVQVRSRGEASLPEIRPPCGESCPVAAVFTLLKMGLRRGVPNTQTLGTAFVAFCPWPPASVSSSCKAHLFHPSNLKSLFQHQPRSSKSIFI